MKKKWLHLICGCLITLGILLFAAGGYFAVKDLTNMKMDSIPADALEYDADSPISIKGESDKSHSNSKSDAKTKQEDKGNESK